MSKAIWIFLFICTSFAFANSSKAEQNSFAGIPFGTLRQTVIEEILKLGYEPYGMAESSDRIVIPVYMMGELPVQVDFLFNRNDKFYSFEIRTGRIEAMRLTKVFEAANYMSEHFALKYGEAGKQVPLNESTLRRGTNLYREWFSVRTLDIYTAVISKDGRYYSLGAVVQRTLAKELPNASKTKSSMADTKPAF